MKLVDTVPVRAHHDATGLDQEAWIDLEAERFGGVLMHPVLRTTMGQTCGIDTPAWKIVAKWPKTPPIFPELRQGDQLEIAGRIYPILAVNEVPTCYLELYVNATP